MKFIYSDVRILNIETINSLKTECIKEINYTDNENDRAILEESLKLLNNVKVKNCNIDEMSKKELEKEFEECEISVVASQIQFTRLHCVQQLLKSSMNMTEIHLTSLLYEDDLYKISENSDTYYTVLNNDIKAHSHYLKYIKLKLDAIEVRLNLMT